MVMVNKLRNFFKLRSLVIGFISLLAIMYSYKVIAGDVAYVYDNINRLTQVTYENGTTVYYTYDAVGNRLVKEVINSQVGENRDENPILSNNLESLPFLPTEITSDYLYYYLM